MRTPLRVVLQGALLLPSLGLLFAAVIICRPISDADHLESRPAQVVEESKEVMGTPREAEPETWLAFSSKIDAFEAWFPVAPEKENLETAPEAGDQGTATSYFAQQDGQALGVSVCTFAGSLPSDLEWKEFSVEGCLDGARDGALNGMGATLVSEKQIEFAGLPARRVLAKIEAKRLAGGPFRVELCLFFAGPPPRTTTRRFGRLYTLLVMTPQSDELAAWMSATDHHPARLDLDALHRFDRAHRAAQKFFDSFTLLQD